jgi:hypothetical protein
MCRNLNKEENEPFDIRRANPSHPRSYCKKPKSVSNDTPKAHREVTVKLSATLTELAMVGFLAIVGAGIGVILRRRLKR